MEIAGIAGNTSKNRVKTTEVSSLVGLCGTTLMLAMILTWTTSCGIFEDWLQFSQAFARKNGRLKNQYLAGFHRNID